MFTYESDLYNLVELHSCNQHDLFTLMCDHRNEYKQLVTDEEFPYSENEFELLLNEWFSSGRLYQFLAYLPDGQLIGTVFFTKDKLAKNSIAMSCFFTPKVRGKFVVSKVLLNTLVFGYKFISAKRIIFAIYQENKHMLQIAKRIKAKKIGEMPSNSNPLRTIILFEISFDFLKNFTAHFI